MNLYKKIFTDFMMILLGTIGMYQLSNLVVYVAALGAFMYGVLFGPYDVGEFLGRWQAREIQSSYLHIKLLLISKLLATVGTLCMSSISVWIGYITWPNGWEKANDSLAILLFVCLSGIALFVSGVLAGQTKINKMMTERAFRQTKDAP